MMATHSRVFAHNPYGSERVVDEGGDVINVFSQLRVAQKWSDDKVCVVRGHTVVPVDMPLCLNRWLCADKPRAARTGRYDQDLRRSVDPVIQALSPEKHALGCDCPGCAKLQVN